jgi:hypothetical protein
VAIHVHGRVRDIIKRRFLETPIFIIHIVPPLARAF